jgi:hypothetical protein
LDVKVQPPVWMSDSSCLFPLSLYGTSNNPKGRVPRALPVGEWKLARRASSIACALEQVPRAMPVGIYELSICKSVIKE